MTIYRGCTLSRTGTTTNVRRVVFGHSYQAIAYVWAISGRLSKPAGQRPFLTSEAACREFVREADEHNARAAKLRAGDPEALTDHARFQAEFGGE